MCHTEHHSIYVIAVVGVVVEHLSGTGNYKIYGGGIFLGTEFALWKNKLICVATKQEEALVVMLELPDQISQGKALSA